MGITVLDTIVLDGAAGNDKDDDATDLSPTWSGPWRVVYLDPVHGIVEVSPPSPPTPDAARAAAKRALREFH